MSFEYPGALWLLLILPCLLLVLGLWGWLVRRDIAGTFQLDLHCLTRRHLEKYVLIVVLVVLLVGAVASPRLSHFSVAKARRSGEIVLLVDVSPSMAAKPDLETPTRLERVQAILYELIDQMAELRDVRLSLHAFTSIARSHVPFVGEEDYAYLRESIGKVLAISSIPGQGTSLGRPIQQVLDKFSENGNAKLIVLFSDGEPFIGLTRGMYDLEREWIEQAVDKALQKDVQVITVGVGEPGGAKIPISDSEGNFTQEYAKLRGADYVTYLDEGLLADIAARTGGRYFYESDRRALATFIEQSLSPGGGGAVEQVEDYRYVGHWLLLAALPVWLLLARRHLL
jgi:uncharacterized protein YegL